MKASASIARHPIRLIPVRFPIGLWIFSLVCDVIGLFVALGIWIIVGSYTMVGGLGGALAAAVPGSVDLLYYKDGLPPVKKNASTHMTINLSVVVLCAVNIWSRTKTRQECTCPPSFGRLVCAAKAANSAVA